MWNDDREYDRYLARCEALDLDPMSPLTPYVLENLYWDFVPCDEPDFLPEFDADDIPFH